MTVNTLDKPINLISLYKTIEVEGTNVNDEPCKYMLPKGFIPVTEYHKPETGEGVDFKVDGVNFYNFKEAHSVYSRLDTYVGYYSPYAKTDNLP